MKSKRTREEQREYYRKQDEYWREYPRRLELFRERFLALHPKEGWPEWLGACALLRSRTTETGQPTLALEAEPELPPGEGEFYRVVNGQRLHMGRDAETGKEYVILSRTFRPSELTTLFEAIIDTQTSTVTVLVDRDFSMMDGTQFSRKHIDLLSKQLWPPRAPYGAGT